MLVLVALFIVSATLSFPRRRESISTLAPSVLQRWIPAFAGKTLFEDLDEAINKAALMQEWCVDFGAIRSE